MNDIPIVFGTDGACQPNAVRLSDGGIVYDTADEAPDGGSTNCRVMYVPANGPERIATPEEAARQWAALTANDKA